MADRAPILAALQNTNVQAFLRLLRNGESHVSNDEAYRALFGWEPSNTKVFNSFDDHPRVRTYEVNDEFIRNGKKDYTTAAGAYQITESTWDTVLIRKYGPLSFTPAEQDFAAVALTAYRGALDDVLSGRVVEAMHKCRLEWASLPTATYGQPTQSSARALAVYEQWGGRFVEAASPAPPVEDIIIDPVPVVPELAPSLGPSIPQEEPATNKETVMAPLIPIFTALLPELLKAVPVLSSLFPKSEVAERNVAAATAITNAVVNATKSANLQEAVERMGVDPAARSAATAAISDIWPQLVEVGGGVVAARAAVVATGDIPLRHQAPFIMALLFFFLILLVTLGVMLKLPWIAEVTSDTRAGVIMFIIGTFGGGIVGFYYGTTQNSARKTELMGGKL